MVIENELYATAGDYRMLLSNSDPSRDDEINDDLYAICRVIDKKLKTFFWKETTATVRYFTPEYKLVNTGLSNGVGWAESENPWRHMRGVQTLWIDPIYDVTDLEVIIDTDRDGSYADETPLLSSEYVLLPRNALVGPEPSAYMWIDRRDAVWTPGSEVRITARWGRATVPKAIQRACVHICGILRIESPRATRRISELEGVVETSKACQEILDTLLSTYSRKVPI